jgi:hypothetical protein
MRIREVIVRISGSGVMVPAMKYAVAVGFSAGAVVSMLANSWPNSLHALLVPMYSGAAALLFFVLLRWALPKRSVVSDEQRLQSTDGNEWRTGEVVGIAVECLAILLACLGLGWALSGIAMTALQWAKSAL